MDDAVTMTTDGNNIEPPVKAGDVVRCLQCGGNGIDSRVNVTATGDMELFPVVCGSCDGKRYQVVRERPAP